MAVKKAPVRKSAAKAKKSAKRAPPRKKTARSKKGPSTFKRVENAILATVAEVDEIALDMGLLGATLPKKRRKTR